MPRITDALPRLLSALALVLVTGLATISVAQEPATESKDYGEVSRTTYAISQEILSPFCPGKTLAMCPSPAAAEVRREIQAMAAQGVEKEAIKAQIIETYGEEFRTVEPPRSDNLLLLSAVAVGLILCILVVVLISRSRKDGDSEPIAVPTGGAGPEPEAIDEDDPYLAELRERYRD